MPNTKITSQKLKDHLSYAKKVYIIGAIVAAAFCSLLFSMTRYQAPTERAVQIALVDAYTMPDNLNDVVPALLSAGQYEDDSLEAVLFFSIAYSGNSEATSEEDYYGAQLYMVQLYAGDNDIYIQSETLTRDLVKQLYCVPLETMDGFDEFVAKNPDVNILWIEEPDPEAAKEEEEDEEPVPAEELPARPLHAYAIDISTLEGMAERGAYANKGKFASIVVTSKNADTSFTVLRSMFDLLTPAPETEAMP